MALTDDQQKRALRDLADELGKDGPVGLTKAQIIAAIVDLDAFFTTNATAINNALPQPARGVLTTSQKAALAAFVMVRRWGA